MGRQKLEQNLLFLESDCTELAFDVFRKISQKQMSQRWSEVESSIKKNKHFKMTTEELLHAVKYAWRNATRCIGKIWWETLALRDCRHVKSVDELFKKICQHLKESTNNGKIKPTISVFPQRMPGESDQFRIWNSNVLMYAGYLDPNDTGSVIGNKSNVEFTQVSNLGFFFISYTRYGLQAS